MGNTRGVMAKVPDSNFKINEIELESLDYIYFQTNTLFPPFQPWSAFLLQRWVWH